MAQISQTKHFVGILYGNPDNRIIIEPPLTAEKADRLVRDNILTASMIERSYLTEEPVPATNIFFGRLILGNEAMDAATKKLAEEIRSALDK